LEDTDSLDIAAQSVRAQLDAVRAKIAESKRQKQLAAQRASMKKLRLKRKTDPTRLDFYTAEEVAQAAKKILEPEECS
jgi:hypothetical protein